MRITRKQLRRLIKEEAEQLQLDLGIADNPQGEYGTFAKTSEVQTALTAAGFNADGSFGADGYPGPSNWQMYSPENMEEAEGWITAAIEMNNALRKAEKLLASGTIVSGQDAFYDVIYPVQEKYADHGAADTEGREVAGDWLENKGFQW